MRLSRALTWACKQHFLHLAGQLLDVQQKGAWHRPNASLTEEHIMLRDGVRKFCEKEIAPVVEQDEWLQGG
jgi:hypothetical protein